MPVRLRVRTEDVWHVVALARPRRGPRRRRLDRHWDRRCHAAGVPRITVRDARRTCGSLLADLDVHPRVAMQILRHAKFSITMEIYTVVSSKSTREALKRLGASLG